MSYEHRADELLAAARTLEPIGEEMAATLRPSVRLVTDGPGTSSPRSRIGGSPDVPEGFVWPTWQVTSRHWLRADSTTEQPLDFVAQIDLGDLASVASGHDLGIPGLPDSGLLLFFVDTDACSGLSLTERPGFHVELVEDGRATAPAVEPAGAQTFGSLAVRMRVEPTVADIQRFAGSRDVDDGVHEAIEEQLYPVGPLHRVGGHPDPIQGPVEVEAAMVVTGAFDPGASVDHARAAAEAEERDAWRLLLQVDSDASMMWGDAGMLYFLIDVTGDASFTDRISPTAAPPRLWHLMQCH